jgi:hypothetical protein
LRIRDDGITQIIAPTGLLTFSDLLDQQQTYNRKNTGNEKYSLEKRFLKHEKNKKEILVLIFVVLLSFLA